jgi:SagB-type dehydrogenase family enzyme
MSTQANVVDARWIGRAFATDRDLFLPARLRLIPEMVVVEYGTDGLLFSGGEQLEVIRGKSARTLLMRALPLLDGSRTLEEIAGSEPGLSRKTLHDIVSLLFSRGLLEDAAPEGDEEIAYPELGSYAGRFVDVTRSNRNRQEALARLEASSVAVLGAEGLAAAFVEQLREHGIGQVKLARKLRNAAKADLAVVISTGDLKDVERLVREVSQACPRVLLLRFGSAEAHIGPMFHAGATSCPACFFRTHPHPEGVPESALAAYWSGIGSLQVFHTLAKLAPSRTQREFRVLRIDEAGEMRQESYASVRRPGCAECGIPHSPLAQDDQRLLAWIYHCATSFPSREMLSPRDHQSHYSVANLQLAREEKPSLGDVLAVRLPEALPLSSALRIDGEGAVVRRPLDLAGLATLLRNAAGEAMENGVARRVAPTGGNLGSVDLWVAAGRVDGLNSGIYRYHGTRHRLEWVGALCGELPESAGSPECFIIGTGDLARCAQKYQNFAYRLIYYDSGVALAHLYAVAANLGIAVAEQGDLDDLALAELLGIPARWEFPIPTFALAIGGDPVWPNSSKAAPVIGARLCAADYASSDLLSRILRDGSAAPLHPSQPPCRESIRRQSAPEPAIGSLDDVLRTRKAVREYAPRPIGRTALEALMLAARAMSQRRRERGAPPCPVRPVLGVAIGGEDLPAAIYELDEGGELQRRAGFDSVQMRECFNQNTFGDAPAAIFTVADLGEALAQRGLRGYREIGQHAGSMVGSVWLTATALGLAGTAAGGVIPSGLRGAAGMDGFRECPLLAFPMGYAAQTVASTQQVF